MDDDTSSRHDADRSASRPSPPSSISVVARAVSVVGLDQPAVFTIFVVLAVVVGWSRVRLGRHSFPEVRGGAALGVLAALAQLVTASS